ncbi:DNA repair protein RecO [Candidatus Parcubacteria bacterium]|nr:DNA repair protein RecO [Candidatus Parcubacteria bacterium]
MDETYTTKAIILNRQPFREFDSKTTVYSMDKGKLELVIRGAKKIKSKLAGHLEPINLSDLMIIRGRNFDYVGGAVSGNCYGAIKSDLEKLMLAGRVVNVFNKLIKMEDRTDVEVIFRLLQSILDALNRGQKPAANPELLFNFFVLRLMSQLGHKPELYNCVVCRKKIVPNENRFDLSRGGLVCLNCQKNNKNKQVLLISTDCIKVLRLAVESDFSRLTKLKINDILGKEIINIISSFLKFHS